MTRKVYISATNALTALGLNPEDTLRGMREARSGIRLWEDEAVSAEPFWASRLDFAALPLDPPREFSRFERMVAHSIALAAARSPIDLRADTTLFLFSTTKGNIDLLPDGGRLKLEESCAYIARYFGNANRPVVVSNACISGTAAIILGKRFIQSGRYRHVVAVGADLVSAFVLSGFQSFKALSEGPCKPFDRDRTGLSLGEGAATMILSADNDSGKYVDWIVAGGSISNDANHISGPSRNGEGLALAIEAALSDAGQVGIPRENLGFISAHGTATPYNDEMEAKALNAAGLQNVPLSSYKGYWGHTLGAAGLIEAVMTLEALSERLLLPSLNYVNHGVSLPLDIVVSERVSEATCFLKTSSGFGGCNAALVIGKI